MCIVSYCISVLHCIVNWIQWSNYTMLVFLCYCASVFDSPKYYRFTLQKNVVRIINDLFWSLQVFKCRHAVLRLMSSSRINSRSITTTAVSSGSFDLCQKCQKPPHRSDPIFGVTIFTINLICINTLGRSWASTQMCHC